MRVVDVILQAAMSLAAPSGDNARLPIIFYHRVLTRPDPLLPDTPDVRLFDLHMRTLARVFNVVDLSEGLAALRAGTLPSRALCITFDDGYRDNPEIALPILCQYRLTATFFIASGLLGNGRLFADTVIEAVRRIPSGNTDFEWFGLGMQHITDEASRLALINKLVADIKYRDLEGRKDACERLTRLATARLPDNLMMTAEQLKSLHRAGMAVGGHTADHPILACQDARSVRRQVTGDRECLAAIIGSAPLLFAYPNGRLGRDFTEAHVGMVREAGYSGAVTTDAGCASSQSDPYLLPRQSPWQQSPLRLIAGIARSTRSKTGEGPARLLSPAGA